VTESSGERLSAGYRVIRLLAAGAESPWKGSLVSRPTGQMGVLVDTAALGDDWGGWDAAATGHVLAPVEILRRTDGHDVVLPVCTERLEDFLSRRAAGAAELSTGEAVTVAVSLLRGLAEALGGGRSGSWWLTDSGRPVLATDSTTSSVEDATVELLRTITDTVPELEPALAGVIDASVDPRRLPRELDRAEHEIFAIAEPLPLATTTFGAKIVRDRTLAATSSIVEDVGAPSASWPFSLVRHLDADWADLLSRTTTGVWRMMRTRRPGRRKPWLIAGGLAGAIVVGGLMWPTEAGGPATAEVPSNSASVSSAAAPTPSIDQEVGVPTPPPVDEADGPAIEETPADLASITDALLTARVACEEDTACLSSIVEADAGEFPVGVVDLPPDQRTVTLLDTFGGAAVLRIDGGGDPQLVTVVHADSRWLLRDVYDIAEQ